MSPRCTGLAASCPDSKTSPSTSETKRSRLDVFSFATSQLRDLDLSSLRHSRRRPLTSPLCAQHSCRPGRPQKLLSPLSLSGAGTQTHSFTSRLSPSPFSHRGSGIPSAPNSPIFFPLPLSLVFLNPRPDLRFRHARLQNAYSNLQARLEAENITPSPHLAHRPQTQHTSLRRKHGHHHHPPERKPHHLVLSLPSSQS